MVKIGFKNCESAKWPNLRRCRERPAGENGTTRELGRYRDPSDGSGNLSAIVAADRAFPAAVAELDRCAKYAMRIRDTLIEDAAAVAALIDSVVRERRYLAATVGFSAESTHAFIASLRSANGVHILAWIGGAVVGWCDITPSPYEGMKHVGRLGMGVKSGFRGKGTGKRLLEAALLRGFNTGLERVELEVFGSNREAVRLYESFGFVREGRKIAARKLDGISDDLLLYATFKKA